MNWIKLAWRAIRKFQSTLLLGLIYALLIVPAGLIRRILKGRDIKSESYFVECSPDFDGVARMDKPF